MLRLNENCNILVTLRNRELGAVTSPQKLGYNILYHTICSTERTFKNIWRHNCDQRISCEDCKLYLHEFTECRSLWGYDNVPSYLYHFEKRRENSKIIDGIICCGRHISNDPGPLIIKEPTTYRGFFLAVSNNNWLLSYDNETGKILQEVYLGNPNVCKFKHCLWETVGDRVYVTCNVRKKKLSQQHNTNQQQPHVLAVIAVFTVFPIQFRAMMEITDSVFGNGVRKVNVDGSTLIIGHGSTNNSVICIYNFNHILEQNILYTARLGEPCESLDNHYVGSYPVGLPYNCKITETPPLLFRVKCSDYAVHFGGIPWHYMVMQPKQKESIYQIRRLFDDAEPFNSVLFCDELSFENERAYFHYDYSERIIFECPNEIKMYNVNASLDTSVTSIEPAFSMNFYTSEPSMAQTPKSRSLRKIVPKRYFCAIKSVMCMDYEDQLDLIAILGFNPTDAHCEGKIRLYDNFTGALVKVIDIGITIEEVLKYDLVFNLDTFVVIEAQHNKRFQCHVFRLFSPESSVKVKDELCVTLNYNLIRRTI